MTRAHLLLFSVFLVFLYFLLITMELDFDNEHLLPRAHSRILSGGRIVMQTACSGNFDDLTRLIVLPISQSIDAVSLRKAGHEVCVLVDDKNSSLMQRLIGRARCAWNRIPYGRGASLIESLLT